MSPDVYNIWIMFNRRNLPIARSKSSLKNWGMAFWQNIRWLIAWLIYRAVKIHEWRLLEITKKLIKIAQKKQKATSKQINAKLCKFNVKVCDRILGNHMTAAGLKFWKFKTKPYLRKKYRKVCNGVAKIMYTDHLISGI